MTEQIVNNVENEEDLSPTVGKRQYLVTLSQADLTMFPTRESFGKLVAEEFNRGVGL